MKIQSVDTYHSPNIPTRDYVDDNPEILNHIPQRWLSNAAVLTALAGTVMLVSSCKSNTARKTASLSKVAPIFQHGEGIGSFGCIAINPPIFLSEAEAKDVIRQESLKAGLKLVTTQNSCIGIHVPKYSHKLRKRTGYKISNVSFDGVDKKKFVFYKYISEKNAYKLSPEDTFRATVYQLNMQQVAKSFRCELKGSGRKGVYGVFYDPLVSKNIPSYKKYESKFAQDRAVAEQNAKTEAKQLLRAQVKDFIKWLKTEGII